MCSRCRYGCAEIGVDQSVVRVYIVLGVYMIYARVGDARGYVIWDEDVVDTSALVWTPSSDIRLGRVQVWYDRCVCIRLAGQAEYEKVDGRWAAGSTYSLDDC